MRWLISLIEKTCNGRVLIIASAALAAGCSANPPEAENRGQLVGASKSTGIEVSPDVSADVPRAQAQLADHTLRVGTSPSWVAIRIFTFDYDNSSIGAADANKAAEISEYVSRNPTLRIVIDGSVNPRGIDPHNPGLRDRRVEVVREALIAAGVSPFMIETRASGSERVLGDRSIEVLVRTAL